jgi:flagellar motor switch protein FliM
VGAALQLPPVRLAGRELEGLYEGKILKLPMVATGMAELRVSGVPLFEGYPVNHEEQRGAHLVKIATAAPAHA